jgi:hypothetical protein
VNHLSTKLKVKSSGGDGAMVGGWMSNEVRDSFYKFICKCKQSLQTSDKVKRLAKSGRDDGK